MSMTRCWVALALLSGLGAGCSGGGNSTPDAGPGGPDASPATDAGPSADAGHPTDAAASPDASGCTGGDHHAINPANGHCYVFFTDQKIWSAAKTQCEALGGHLPTVTSAAENAFLQTNIGVDQFWLGSSDQALEGTFTWITGEPFAYTNWSPGEPNNGAPGPPENCVQITGPLAGATWNDTACGTPRNVMCEIE